MQLNQKDWSCEKKRAARHETIVAVYRQVFGRTIPLGKQYWTLAGQCATTTGDPLNGCEPLQVIQSGLISPGQYVGVELNPQIHELNVAAFPELTWACKDFYRAMLDAYSEDRFDPGVVNLDLPRTPDGGVAYIGKTLAFLTHAARECLFVVNVIIRQRFYTTKNGDYIIEMLKKNKLFASAWAEGGWELWPDWYRYQGAGQTGGRTEMGTVVFIRR